MNNTKLALIHITAAAALALATACAPQPIIYVDQANKSGPWDGSKTHPFKTIQDGLNKAKINAGEIVEVRGGVYAESLVMKPGTVLRRAADAGSVVIQGTAGKPTILAKDYDAISGFLIEAGTPAVLFKLAADEPPVPDALTSVANCKIEATDAIQIETSNSLSFGSETHRKFEMWTANNWILPASGGGGGGTGIRVSLVGPKTGELSLKLRVADNVIQQKSTAIDVQAIGQGPNPGGITRALAAGTLDNNLLFFNGAGIRLTGENLGSAEPTIFNNTIAHNSSHAIVADAASGPDGDSATHPDVINNVIAMNQGFGYLELAKKTSAKTLSHNLFFQNSQGHYQDEDSGSVINTQTGLNTPIVSNKVVFVSGEGNVVADPRFIQGTFSWNGKTWGQEKAGSYFLQHAASSPSPGIDKGLGTAMQAGLHLKSTRTDFKPDSGTVDLGFHYREPYAE